LLAQEIELRRAMEAVAAARRELPPGGPVKMDYVFQEMAADGEPTDVRLSELFDRGKTSLVIYSFIRILRIRLLTLNRCQAPLLAGDPPPMVDQLVARHANQPAHGHLLQPLLLDRGHRGHECLGGQILRHRHAAASRQQVPIDLRQRSAVDRHDRIGT
jgi:hypothetical protein